MGKAKKARQEAAEYRRAPPHVQRNYRWERAWVNGRFIRRKRAPLDYKEPPKRVHVDGPKERPLPERPDRGRNSEHLHKRIRGPLPPPRIRRDPRPGDLLTVIRTVPCLDDNGVCQLRDTGRPYYYSARLNGARAFYYGTQMTYIGFEFYPREVYDEVMKKQVRVMCLKHMLFCGTQLVKIISTTPFPGEIWDFFNPLQRAKKRRVSRCNLDDPDDTI